MSVDSFTPFTSFRLCRFRLLRFPKSHEFHFGSGHTNILRM